MSLASQRGGSPAPLPPALKPGRAQDAADPSSGDDPATAASSDSSSPRTRVWGLAPAPSASLCRESSSNVQPAPSFLSLHLTRLPWPGQTPHSSLPARSPGAGPLTPRCGVDTRSASLPSLCRGLGPSTQQVCAGSWDYRAPSPEERGLAGLGSRRTVAPAPGHMRSFSTELSPRVTRSCVTVGFFPQLEHPRLQWPQFTEQLLHQPRLSMSLRPGLRVKDSFE